MIGELNLMLKGWANYFRLGSVSKKAWIATFEIGCANGWDESTR